MNLLHSGGYILGAAVRQFLKVTRSYWRGLFRCAQVPGLPQTNNDLEHCFGSARYHERRASGRRFAAPGTVVRGAVRVVAAVSTRLQPCSVAQLAPSDLSRWRTVRQDLEARHATRRVLARWARYELIAIDEVGYVPLAEVGAEFLFQVIAERAERPAVILTTNLPFSEWTQVIPNTRLCKALLDRITDRAHIIETGSESYRFRRTLAQRRRKEGETTTTP